LLPKLLIPKDRRGWGYLTVYHLGNSLPCYDSHPDMLITDALHRLAELRESLSREQARAVMAEILAGNCTDAQIAGLLVAMHMKGETVEEIVGFAEAIRAAAAPLALASSPASQDSLVDTCGTGGDGTGTFNISTATALTVAGAGVRVAKHGNRSVTSRCGSADIMEALGVKLTLTPERLSACLEHVGIAFLLAPNLHTAMKYVQPARRQLRPLPTVFNLLGPLTNPAKASAQVVGVYSAEIVEKLAHALLLLGLKRAMVVHGSDGLDEITITGPTKVAEVRDGSVHCYEITPEQFGLPRSPLAAIAGGDIADNTAMLRDILEGARSPRRDIVLLNAAATLVAAGRAESIGEALPMAAQSLDSGCARAKLAALVAFTNAE
jgi:anthranilate phosphoribosyltransferase